MLQTHLNIQEIEPIKEMLETIHAKKDLSETVQNQLATFDKNKLRLIAQQILHEQRHLTMGDFIHLNKLYDQAIVDKVDDKTIMDILSSSHPAQIFTQENQLFQIELDEMDTLIQTALAADQIDQAQIKALPKQINHLGEMFNHYNRKQKLIFPIAERYGHYSLTRIMWMDDDEIRKVFQVVKRNVANLPKSKVVNLHKHFTKLKTLCQEMIAKEVHILLPIVLADFSEEDWQEVYNESKAFGFAFMEPVEEWEPTKKADLPHDPNSPHLKFGGGFLTLKEANLILNNLPVEITFVDKNGIFKYFNEKLAASDMLLVRTSSSIGRNVANCHPPKSMKKVMRLIRDLKLKKRDSESMWFKQGDQFVHITYQALFDEDDEYMGILETVQDIQAFIDLPRPEKKGLSKIEE